MSRSCIPGGQRIALFEQGVGRDDTPIFFTVKGCIGMGASSIAYEAVSDAGLPVVLKQLSPTEERLAIASMEELERRFILAHRRQLEFVNKPGMNNIVAALSGFYRDSYGVPWVSSRGTFSRAYSRIAARREGVENLRFIKLLAEGVLAFHRAGYLVLDITPDNVLFIEELGISAVSFFDLDSFEEKAEIARAVTERRSISLLSTNAYAPPELSGGIYGPDLSKVNELCDIYSIGAVLYFTLFGKPPRETGGFLSWRNSIPGRNYDLSAVSWNASGAPAGETAERLNALLQKTLCVEQSGRYKSCEELIADIDALIAIQTPREPRLKKNMPAARPGFVGRTEQLETLSALLEKGGPVFVSGMAGMGKTELVLRAAENLKSRYDFYYMPFSGTLRESLAALPAENLPESAREDAAERVELITAQLEKLDGRSVLVIDNFDAADESRTAKLTEDPLFARLAELPLKLIFTSRCRFEGFDTLALGALDKSELRALCAARLPDEREEDRKELCALLRQHTLSVDIAARTLAASGGKPGIKELCRKLRAVKIPGGDGTAAALELLRALLSAFSPDADSRWLMGFFCLAPASGVDSSLLSELLDEKRWAAARRLGSCGWLRHEESTERWSVHALLERLYMSEKRLRPDRESFAALTEKLREMEAREDYRRMDADIHRQIEAIFANYTRKAVGKSRGRLAAAVALGLGLLAVAAGVTLSSVLHWRELNADPEQRQFDAATVELTVGTTASVTPEAAAADLEKLNARLRLIAGDEKTAFTVGEDGYYHVSLPLSRFIDRGGDLDYVLDHTLVYTGELFFVDGRSMSGSSLDDSSAFTFETVYSGLEYVDSYGESEYISAARPHLELSLTEAAIEEIEAGICPVEDMSLAYQGALIPTLPGGEDRRFVLFLPELTEEGVLDALVHCFTNEPLSAGYSYYYSVTPEAIWEDPAAIERSGGNQRSREELGGDTVTAFFTAYSPEDMSEHEFELEKTELRRRLDALELPYAFGTAIAGSRVLTVALPAGEVSEELLGLICASRPGFTGRKDSFFGEDESISPGSARIIETSAAGTYALELDFAEGSDSYNLAAYESFLERAKALGLEELYFCADYSGRPLLSAKLDMALAEKGKIIFTGCHRSGAESMGAEYLPLLRAAKSTVGSRAGLYSLSDWHFDAPGLSFAYVRSTPEEQRFRAFAEAQGGVELRFESGADAKFVLDGPVCAENIRRGMDMAERFLTDIDLCATTLSSVYFDFGSGEVACRLCINVGSVHYRVETETAMASGMPLGWLSFSGVCRGAEADALFEEFVGIYREKEFYRFSGLEKWGLDPKDSCNIYRPSGAGFSIVPLYGDN